MNRIRADVLTTEQADQMQSLGKSLIRGNRAILEVERLRKVVEAARNVIEDSGFANCRADETYGPRAEDFPASYTVLHAALSQLDSYEV